MQANLLSNGKGQNVPADRQLCVLIYTANIFIMSSLDGGKGTTHSGDVKGLVSVYTTSRLLRRPILSHPVDLYSILSIFV